MVVPSDGKITFDKLKEMIWKVKKSDFWKEFVCKISRFKGIKSQTLWSGRQSYRVILRGTKLKNEQLNNVLLAHRPEEIQEQILQNLGFEVRIREFPNFPFLMFLCNFSEIFCWEASCENFLAVHGAECVTRIGSSSFESAMLELASPLPFKRFWHCIAENRSLNKSRVFKGSSGPFRSYVVEDLLELSNEPN